MTTYTIIETNGQYQIADATGPIAGFEYADRGTAERIIGRFVGPTTPVKVQGVMDNRHRNWKRRG